MTDPDAILHEGNLLRREVDDLLREFNRQAPGMIEVVECRLAEAEGNRQKPKWWGRA